MSSGLLTYLNDWLIDSYTPNSKLILGFSVAAASTASPTMQCYLEGFKDLVNTNGLAGINFWQQTSELCSFITANSQAVCPSSMTKCPVLWKVGMVDPPESPLPNCLDGTCTGTGADGKGIPICHS